jgi:hypothetical protein
LLILLSACGGILTWKTVYASTSRDRKLIAQFEETACLADCALQVVAKHGWHTTTIAKKSDCVVFY